MQNLKFSFQKNINQINILSPDSKKFSEIESQENPKNIGPYEILKKYKDGCYSKIYLAKSKYTEDTVIIKSINKSSYI